MADEYLAALRQLSQAGNVELYLRTMAVAWRWTAAMSWTDPPTTSLLLERTNALVDSTEAAARGLRLEQPPL